MGKSRSRLLQVGNSLLQPSSLGGAVALGGGADIPIGKRFSIRVIRPTISSIQPSEIACTTFAIPAGW